MSRVTTVARPICSHRPIVFAVRDSEIPRRRSAEMLLQKPKRLSAEVSAGLNTEPCIFAAVTGPAP